MRFIVVGLNGLEEIMKVRELMTAAPIVATKKTPIREVINMMIDNKIRHVPVVVDGLALGMLSQRDLTFLAGALDLFDGLDESYLDDVIDLPVSHLDVMSMEMTGAVYAVDADADIDEALDILLATPVSALVVTEGPIRKVVGILSFVDILRWQRDERVKKLGLA